MTHVTEAIYSDGVLRPETPLGLPEQQRVRLIVQPITDDGPSDRSAAMNRLRAGIAKMSFASEGRLPMRDELHDRA